MSHCKRQYELECHEGFYIPTVITKFPKQPSAFRTPFLDALQLTPEVRAVITGTGEHGSKTTSEWLGTSLLMKLGGEDKGQGSVKDRTRMMPPVRA